MNLGTTIYRDTEIIGKACIEAFNRAGIPTSVAVDDPECLARVAAALEDMCAGNIDPDWALKNARTALSALKGDG